MTCSHDINQKKHDVIIDKRRKNLVFPEVIRGVCKKCGYSVSYIKVDGVYIEQSRIDD